MLGLTKMIAVRQVQQWWLSLIVVNYKRTANKKFKQKTRIEKEIKERIENIGQRDVGNKNGGRRRGSSGPKPRLDSEFASVEDYFHNMRDASHGLNDIHAAYWAELDKMYAKTNNNKDKYESSSDEETESESETEDTMDHKQQHQHQPHDNTLPVQVIHHKANSSGNNAYGADNDDEYDPNYDPIRDDDDNISMRIEKMNRKRQNTLKAQQQRQSKVGDKSPRSASHRKKKKKKETTQKEEKNRYIC